MADSKISQLPDGSPAQANDQIPINRGGTNFRVNAGTVSSLIEQVATITLSSAQLLALQSNPVQLLPPPGVNSAIIVWKAVFQYRFGTVAYNLANGGRLCIGPAGNEEASAFLQKDPVGLLDMVKNTVGWEVASRLSSYQNNFNNVAVNIAQAPALLNWTAGDGTLVLTIFYSVVTLQ